MAEWEAPAKLNLSLRVQAPDTSGYHPLRSLVQTVEWCDTLSLAEADEDRLAVEGALGLDDRSNLMWKAVDALSGDRERPRLQLKLFKRIPVAAGLGGGSSDAAAALHAFSDMTGWAIEEGLPSKIGADVPFLLIGGTAWMEGYGESITPIDSLKGFATGIVVPPFEMPTRDVYMRWDELGGPVDGGISGRYLPPSLRSLEPMANDLTAAACSLDESLAYWIAELAARWERPVCMSGSGPALFSYFADVEEAEAALGEVPSEARAVAATRLRSFGPVRIDR